MRKPVIDETSKYFSDEWKNPVSKKYSSQLDKAFGYRILPKASEAQVFKKDDAQLYISSRDLLIAPEGESRDSDAYEEYLNRLFWDADINHKRVVILEGDVGCGKSTLLEFFIRSYCPHSVQGANLYEHKLIINVNVNNSPTTGELHHKFFTKAKDLISKRCKERGFDINSTSSELKSAQPRRWVELALAAISEVAGRGEEAPFQYIALCIDNLDQTPPEVQREAVRLVADWIEPDSTIKVWQIYIPLWPNTLTSMLRAGAIQLPPEDYTIVKLGRVDAHELLDVRTRYASGLVRDTPGTAGSGDDDEDISNTDCAKLLMETIPYASRAFVELVSDLLFGDLRNTLTAWKGLVSSRTIYNAKRVPFYKVQPYDMLDAVLTGRYRYFNSRNTDFINMYGIQPNPRSCRDMLVGPHLLMILLRGFDSYRSIYDVCESLGYSKQAVRHALDLFNDRKLFHKQYSGGDDVSIALHQRVASAYRELITKPAYLDAMSIVTPVDSRFSDDGRMRPSVAYNRNDFVARVETTLQFIKQVKSDEQDFCSLASLPPRVNANVYPLTFDRIQIDCLWREMAEHYFERLENLHSKGYLKEADGATESWWDSVLTDTLFAESKAGPRYLHPA